MTPPSEKIPDEILEEEDVSLTPPNAEESQSRPTELTREKNTRDIMNLKKFALGSSTLGWCIFLMMVCIFISLWKPDNELVKNGFEAFKLIVMTILGYLFGSNNSKEE